MQVGALLALMFCSALVTFDGTAVTVALSDIGRGLAAGVSQLQWVANASLVMLAALILPAGALGDRFGRRRVTRIGLLTFAAGSLACAAAPSSALLIAARLVQGAGAALIVPGGLAILRTAYTDRLERTRLFAHAAAWSGVASAVGPLAGGAVVDLISWRAVFVMSALLSAPVLVLLRAVPESRADQPPRIDPRVTMLLMAIFASVSFALIEGGDGDWSSPAVVGAVAVAVGAMLIVAKTGRLTSLIPREAMAADNCVPANLATAALYFGLFGISFLMSIYTQEVLAYSATWAGVAILPISVAMLLSGRLGQLAARWGSRTLIVSGAALTGAGAVWLAVGPDPLPFTTSIIPGTTAIGAGLALAAGPLTHAAVSSVSSTFAGAASGLHHAMVRAAGLLAIAIVGTLSTNVGTGENISVDGFRGALFLCAGVSLGFGIAFGLRIQDGASGAFEACPAAVPAQAHPE